MPPSTDQLPDLPELPTKFSFKVRSSTPTTMMKRSDPLKDVDDALDRYADSRTRYRDSCKAYESQQSSAAEETVVKAFDQAANDFRHADDCFKGVGQKLLQWGPGQHDTRGDTGAVKDLWQKMQDGRDTIEQGWQTIDTMAMRLGGPEVPKVNHQIWVGGVPGEDAIRNATLWAASGHQVNLWTDKNNLLAGDFKSQTQALRGDPEPAHPAQDPAIKRRVAAWESATPADREAGLDVRLQRSDPAYANKAAVEAQRLQDLQRPGQPFGPGSNITVRDVSELFDPTRSFPDNEGALTPDDRARANLAHQREVGERCNFAASSDVLRPIIEHDEPGVYCDVDVTPPIKGMPKLISEWNGVVAAHLNQSPANRRQQHSTDTPNAELLHRTVQDMRMKDDKLDLPDPIVPAFGNSTLANPAYQHLLRAVEEHINSLRPGSDPAAPTPKYDALRDFAAKYDAGNRTIAAFDNWKGRTASLQEAFEPMPALHAPAEGFRALATSRSTGVSSNAVLASSTPGSPALSAYAKKVVENVEEQFKDPAKKLNYMDDTQRNRDRYNGATMQTTGPSAMGAVMRDLDIDRHGPTVRLPHSYAGNFSTSELDHSWWPKQPDNSPQQRQDGPSRSSVPGGSAQQPVQRVGRPPAKDLTGSTSQGKTVSRSPTR